MQLRHLVGATVGAVGAAAAGNRVLARRADPLGPPLERETGTYRWRGMDIAYTEGGDPEAPDMVLVHNLGRAGTSREFNRIFDRLAETYHVFAPDLPGFGRSGRPPLMYSATLYETFLQDFVSDLTETPIAIGSGVAGAYLVAAATEVELDRLLLVCPTETAGKRESTLGGRMLRVPVIGQAAHNLMTGNRTLDRYTRRHALYDPASISNDDRAYLWQTAHQPGARYPISSMLAGDVDATIDIGATLGALDIDASVVWGRAASTPGLAKGREIADRADAKLIVLDQARTLPHFEQPGAFFDVLADELEASN